MILTTIEETRKHATISANTPWKTILPHAKSACAWLGEEVGDGLYGPLAADYAKAGGDPGKMDPALARFLAIAQPAVANRAAWSALPFMSAQLGDAGLVERHGETSSPAPKWKHDQAAAALRRAADDGMEAALAFLEARAGDYPAWRDGPRRTADPGWLVPNVAEAMRHVDIAGSRVLFLRLRKHFRNIEETWVKKILRAPLYEALKASAPGGHEAPAMKALAAMCRPLVAKAGLYNAIPLLALAMGDNGLALAGDGRGATGDKAFAWYRQALKDGPFGYEGDAEALRAFLKENAGAYPLWRPPGGGGGGGKPAPPAMPGNKPGNKHFSV